MPLLDPEDISEAVLFAIGTPPHVQVIYWIYIFIDWVIVKTFLQIHELTIRPLGETI